MFYLSFFLVLAVLMTLCFFLSKKYGEHLLDPIIKISAIVFVVFTLLSFFLPDQFMCSLSADALSKMTGNKFHAILRWLNLVSFTVLPIAVFQKNKYFEKIASFFCLPMALVNTACFYQYIQYFTVNSYSGLQTVRVLPQNFKDFLLNEEFRTVIFGVIALFQLTALILLTYKNRASLRITVSEIKNLILIFLGVIYISLPIYVPQHLFGHINIKMLRFSLVHIIWIVCIIAIIFVLYLLFQYKPYETKYLLVLAMSWALMLQFSQMFTASSELNVAKLPLQLCNLGSYLALWMLLKKSDKLFHFTLIINVVGAVIAIAILDIKPQLSHLTNLWTVHYIVEHTKVLVIPILCLVLRIFKPIQARSIKHFSIGFTVYYLSVFLIGTISNGIYRMLEGQFIQNTFYANFLFMFDKKVAGELVGFVTPLFENFVIKIGVFEIYPLAQGLVYLVFMVICLLAYLIIYIRTKRQRRDYQNHHYLKYENHNHK